MIEFKGTKGSWKYEGGDNNSIDIILPNDTTITVDRQSRYTGKYVITREEMEANAQLIASAPGMLEAILYLKECRESWSDIHNDVKEKFEKVIQKAIG